MQFLLVIVAVLALVPAFVVAKSVHDAARAIVGLCAGLGITTGADTSDVDLEALMGSLEASEEPAELLLASEF